MILGIVGSRDYNNYENTKNIVLEGIKSFNNMYTISDIMEIVSGGANGVDMMAKLLAKEYNIKFTEYKAEWDKYGRKAGPIRNQLIVDQSTHLIALPTKKSVGTLITINKAEKKNIPIYTKYV